MDKKYFIAVIITLIVLGISIVYTTPKGEGDGMDEVFEVDWISDYDEGLNRAREEGKSIMIDFYTVWCGWCDKLDRETYSDREVASLLNDKLVCIKIDAEENVTLATNYKVYIYPTVIFLSSNGEELGRIQEYKPPEEFLEFATRMIGMT